ncbi:MAG: hypothetical protein OIF40_01045 [Mangrovicoccus sp.]|nr:hypothetical protein [Mangrovicoccus sp.]
MPHDHSHAPHGHKGHNHSHGPADHLHSHMEHADPAADLQVLADEFIDSFRSARDKSAYLELAGVPRELPDKEGGAPLKLVDIRLTTEWQVGTASPSFGSAELSYLPYPGPMVSERANFAFVYVSMTRKEEVDLRQFLAQRLEP